MLTHEERILVDHAYIICVSWINESNKLDRQYFQDSEHADQFAKIIHNTSKRVTVDGYIDNMDEFITLYVLA